MKLTPYKHFYINYVYPKIQKKWTHHVCSIKQRTSSEGGLTWISIMRVKTTLVFLIFGTSRALTTNTRTNIYSEQKRNGSALFRCVISFLFEKLQNIIFNDYVGSLLFFLPFYELCAIFVKSGERESEAGNFSKLI